MSPCLYHESLSNLCFHFYILRNTVLQIYRNTNNKNKKVKVSELQKKNMQIYRNTNYSNIEIHNTKLKKCNLQNCRNRNDRIKKNTSDFGIMGDFWIMGDF